MQSCNRQNIAPVEAQLTLRADPASPEAGGGGPENPPSVTHLDTTSRRQESLYALAD
jgi:hypothetical protein